MKRVLEYLELSKNWMSKITRGKIYLFSFGLMFSVMMTPLISVVSCSESAVTQTYRRFTVAKDAVIFDITKLDPSGLIQGILGTIGTQMKIPAYDLAPSTAIRYAMVKDYLNQANFTKEVIRLKNGDETYDLDFKDVHKNIEELKNIASTVPFDKLDTTIGGPAGANATNIQAVDYTKVILKESDVMNLVSFMNMYDPASIPTRPATPNDFDVLTGKIKSGDPVTDGDKVIETHPYLNLLKAYHKIFYDFVKSDFYKKWIVNKTFVVALNDSKIGTASVRAESGIKTIVKAGEGYDLNNSLSLGIVTKMLPNYAFVKSEEFSQETSNLEFQFFYNLLDLA